MRTGRDRSEVVIRTPKPTKRSELRLANAAGPRKSIHHEHARCGLTKTTVVIHHALVAALRSTITALHALVVIGFTHCRAARENERTYFDLSGQRGLYFIAIVL